MKRQNTISHALCFNCACIYYVSNENEYNCPYCGFAADEGLYRRILSYARTALYYGFQYRRIYEKQIETTGKITAEHALADPAALSCFLAVAALSGIIGGVSYDLVKKVVRKILSNSQKLEQDIGQDRISMSHEMDIEIFVQYIEEFHTGKLNAVDEIKSEIEKEQICWILTDTLPNPTKGPLSREDIREAVKEAFHKYQNLDKPSNKDFDSFWKEID